MQFRLIRMPVEFERLVWIFVKATHSIRCECALLSGYPDACASPCMLALVSCRWRSVCPTWTAGRASNAEVRRGHQGDKGTRRVVAEDMFGRLGQRHAYDQKRVANHLPTCRGGARKISGRKSEYGLFRQRPTALSPATRPLRPAYTAERCTKWRRR